MSADTSIIYVKSQVLLGIAKYYMCPPRMPAIIEIMKSTIIPITNIFLVEDFIC